MSTKEFKQVCVWPGTIVGNTTEKIKKFEEWMKSEFDVEVKYLEEVETNPDVEDGEPIPDTGGRNDIFFAVSSEDIGKFAVKRLMYGIRWWEDVLGNGNGYLYPDTILQKYPKTW